MQLTDTENLFLGKWKDSVRVYFLQTPDMMENPIWGGIHSIF